MRKLILFAAVVFVTVAFTEKADAQKSSPRKEIIVATYNLRLATPQDGENYWPYRKDRVKDLIRYHEFDIFGTQEGFNSQIRDIMEMRDYNFVGVGRDDGMAEGEYSAIIYRKDRFRVLESGTFWLSETPEKPSYGWDAKIRRICTWAKMKDLVSRETFYFFNTHFDHIAETARRESAKMIIAAIDSLAGKNFPVICTGDFNATPDQEPIKIMKTKMRSSRDFSPFVYGPKGTFSGFTVGARPVNDEIDYIFINDKVSVVKYGVLSDSDGKNYPSDHMPVTARLIFK